MEPTKSKVYNPYAVKRIVGKTSMKDLAAKAAANVAREKAKEQKDPEDIIVPQDRDCDECIVVDDDEEDIFADRKPRSSSRSRCRRRRSSVEVEEESYECLKPSPPKKPAKPKRLSKVEKAAKDRKDLQAAASRKAREGLLAALRNAGEVDDCAILDESPSVDPELAEKQLINVLWKFKRYKFNLKPDEPFRRVFDAMAQTMETQANRVLIFGNADPSLIVTALDCLNDVGSERMFLSALREGDAVVEDAIPEAYQINFSVQGAASKARAKVTSDKREPLGSFMARYCRLMGKKEGDFVFSCDGDKLDPTKMADFYDFEGDELIDARLV